MIYFSCADDVHFMNARLVEWLHATFSRDANGLRETCDCIAVIAIYRLVCNRSKLKSKLLPKKGAGERRIRRHSIFIHCLNTVPVHIHNNLKFRRTVICSNKEIFIIYYTYLVSFSISKNCIGPICNNLGRFRR